MNATTLYVEACKCMLVLEQDNGAAWDSLLHLLPKLRQSLTCRVCRGLLVEPYGSHSCFHYVCRGCLRKKRSLNPGCRWCLNLDSLVEDKQIRIVLACYQKLCECVVKSSAVRRLTTQNGEFNNTLAILQEAITSPISLVKSCQDQELVPAEKSIATMANSKMAPSKSRDVVATRAAEVKPLSKRKLVTEPTESADLKKKKRKKHFKGTYYNYNKKKKPGPAKLNRNDNANVSTVKSETVAVQSAAVVVDNKSEEVQVVDDVFEEQTDSHVPIPPATKSVEQKLRSCRCGTWYMKLSSSTVSRCVSSRCPCYSGGYTCQSCQCAYCANPYNNNNNNNNNNIEKGNEDVKLKFVDDKTVVVSGD